MYSVLRLQNSHSLRNYKRIISRGRGRAAADTLNVRHADVHYCIAAGEGTAVNEIGV